MFPFPGLNHQCIDELKFTFSDDCQQKLSYIVCNERDSFHFQPLHLYMIFWFCPVCSLVYHAGVLSGIGYSSSRDWLYAIWKVVNKTATLKPCVKNEKETLNGKDVFDVMFMEFWYKFANKSLLEYFGTVYTFNNELYQIETRCQNQLYLYPTLAIDTW